MNEMKSYRIYFSNGKDIRIEADGHVITGQGHLELYTRKENGFRRTLYIVSAELWTIIDIAPIEDEDETNPSNS